MPWLTLILSGILEAVWATALGASHGFTVLGPTIVFGLGLAASMVGLGWAVRSIPIGTAYAVWTGIGAALTVVWAMVTGAEAVSVAKVVCLIGIVGSVVGLKLVSSESKSASADVPGELGAESDEDATGDPVEPGHERR
ncbi:multidrug efflux SMR transporter [Galactobacter sp.]|uniref:DMT family transporter n=1 Tax=Galactobacter sp. TaxID=2676125 RepID=UPI0025C16DB4|nr:multidrug efflux SMR transporter [Galactobacter sp.]